MWHLPSGVSWGELAAPLALLRELRLVGERVTEALQRSQQGVDLEQRVLAQLRRDQRELEVDRVHAVRDLELQARMPAAAPAADVDADVGVAVQAGAVQARALVEARA